MASEDLFEPFFRGPSWNMWRAIIKAAFAEPMTEAEFDLFRTVADRDAPIRRVRELAVIAGRGAGKDSIASLLATVAAINFDPRGKLRPGEKAVVMCLACDRSQAQIVFGYISAYFRAIPALQAHVIGSTRSTTSLSNAVTIEVHTNSFRAVRGRTLLCCIFDELAFRLDENSSDPDTEVYNGVTPGLARMPKSMLIMISSAHRRQGLLYQRWSKYFGQDKDNVFVVRGTTLQFNPSFDAETIERSLVEDREKYGAEYLSEWRDDLSAFLSRELLESLVDCHIIARPPIAGVQYVAGYDASGGRTDSFTAAISHREKDGSVLLDALFERKSPFNPSEVVAEIVGFMKEYGIRQLTGDNYGAQWVAEAFTKAGVVYVKSPRDRSGVYLDTLPLFTSARARLLDSPRLVSQFASLERRTFPTGRERIDPGPGHDDPANSAAVTMSLAAQAAAPMSFNFPLSTRAREPYRSAKRTRARPPLRK